MATGIFKTFTSTSAAAITALVMLLAPHAASAQATRTWVSGTGDDANPCSRSAPCKTFAGSISKTAANGEINCLDGGGYGAVTITKSLIIDCSQAGGVLNAGSNGIIINAGAGQVTLRNLSIDGVGSGINGVRVLAASSVHLEGLIIRGNTAHGLDISTAASTNVTVTNTVMRENAQHGIWAAPTSGVVKLTVAFSTFAANGLSGIRLNDNAFATVTDSVLTGNGTTGAAVISSSGASNMSLDRVVSSANRDAGVLARGPGATIWLANTLLSTNNYGFFPASGGGAYVSFGNNRVVGNSADGVPTQVVSEL